MKLLMRKKGSLDIRNNSYLYSMVDVLMICFLPVLVIKYMYIKTPTPVISAQKIWDNQRTTFFALFKIHEIKQNDLILNLTPENIAFWDRVTNNTQRKLNSH